MVPSFTSMTLDTSVTSSYPYMSRFRTDSKTISSRTPFLNCGFIPSLLLLLYYTHYLIMSSTGRKLIAGSLLLPAVHLRQRSVFYSAAEPLSVSVLSSPDVLSSEELSSAEASSSVDSVSSSSFRLSVFISSTFGREEDTVYTFSLSPVVM